MATPVTEHFAEFVFRLKAAVATSETSRQELVERLGTLHATVEELRKNMSYSSDELKSSTAKLLSSEKEKTAAEERTKSAEAKIVELTKKLTTVEKELGIVRSLENEWVFLSRLQ
jgi:chromosome segregation ATPase